MKPGLLPRIIACLLALIFIAPTVIIVSTAFTEKSTLTFPPAGFSTRWFEEVLTERVWVSAFQNSFIVGILAAVIAMALGSALALGASRAKGPAASFFTAMALTPMIIPLVFVAIGFYVFFVQIGATGSAVGLAFAHATLGVPFVFVNVLAALRGIDPRTEEAAAMAGASPWTSLWRVTIPLIAPSSIVGGVLAFISSWDEVIVANFIATPTFQTLPVVMFSQSRSGVTPTIAAVSAIVTAISMLLLALVTAAPSISRRLNRSQS